MPYEYEGMLNLEEFKNANEVVDRLGSPFDVVKVNTKGDNVEVTVSHASAGLEPIYMRGSAARTNGETTPQLVFTALIDAAGLRSDAATLLNHTMVDESTARVVLLDNQGQGWIATGDTFDAAFHTGLSAVSLTQ